MSGAVTIAQAETVRKQKIIDALQIKYNEFLAKHKRDMAYQDKRYADLLAEKFKTIDAQPEIEQGRIADYDTGKRYIEFYNDFLINN